MNPSRYQKRRKMLLNLYSKFRDIDREKADRVMKLSYRLDYYQWQKPVILNGRIVVGA